MDEKQIRPDLAARIKEAMENYKLLKGCAGQKTPESAVQWGAVFLESVASSKDRTASVLEAIDTALAETEEDFKVRGQAYKWEAFRARYIEGASYGEIAEKLNSGKNSPDRWCKEVMEKLAVRIFGVDGLKRW